MSLNLDKSAWRRVVFGDVVRNVNETVKDAESAGIDRVIAMEHLDPGELKVERWGSVADGTTFTRKVKPGQTLFGKRRAYQRKVAYAEFEAICSGDIYTFEADDAHLLGELLPFLVQSNRFFDHALDTSAGSLSPRTNWRDLANFEFDLPPLDEQKRIADLLWAIEHHQRSLDDMKAKLTVSTQQLLSSQLTEGESDIADYADILIGFAFRSSEFSLDATESSRRLVRGINIGVGLSRWATNDTVHWNKPLTEKTVRYLLAAGDIVIPMDRPFTADGQLRWAEVSADEAGALLVQRVARLRPKAPELSPLLRSIIRGSSFQASLSNSLTGSFAPHLAHGDFTRYNFEAKQPAKTAEHMVIAELAERQRRSEGEAVSELLSSTMYEIFGGN